MSMYRTANIVVIAITGVCMTSQAQSKPCAVALDVIKEHVERLCSPGALDSKKEKLSAFGELSLKGFIAKLTNLGLKINADYERQITSGPAQNDVAQLISKSIDCKHDIAIKMQSSLIDSCDIVCKNLPEDRQPRTVEGQVARSHIDGNDCCSDGPDTQAHIIPTPGWRLIAATAHLVPNHEIGGTMSNIRTTFSSDHRVTQVFYARRPNTAGRAGDVQAHLVATEVWDGPCP
ncbi:hypothetical protein [Azospirillum brasilense]|uniref:hypothetical protein n=1 Tax=Azospirillum brasilense TaxID=192 RepID=UPI001EDA27F6|nr:hypothetical protein [Azospirillum brasilense]UKJ74508.1 hypothetical protein H1Q64_18285 [Azospirillum brasilense]